MLKHYASSSFSSLRRLANKPSPVTAVKAPRMIDDLEDCVPVFGNWFLEIPDDSEPDSLTDALVPIKVEELADVLSLTEVDSETDVLSETEVDSETDVLSETEVDSETDVLSDLDALVLKELDLLLKSLSESFTVTGSVVLSL